jgi:hypothetical protein
VSKRNALRTLKRHRRIEVLEREAFIQEVREPDSREARKAQKRRKLVARP